MLITFPRYVAKNFATWIGVVSISFSSVIFLFSLLELLRRVAGRKGVSGLFMVKLAFLQTPDLVIKLLPIILLFSAMLSIAKLNKTLQFVVARASGLSLWQILTPFLAVTTAVSFLVMLVLGPLSTLATEKFERLSKEYISKKNSHITVSESGLWLQKIHKKGYTIIHANRVDEKNLIFYDVSIFEFDPNSSFLERVDAKTANLGKKSWLLKDVLLTKKGAQTKQIADFEYKTNLTFQRIQENFMPPKTIPLWEILDYIRIMEESGFSSVEHWLYFYSSLSLPLLLAAMVVLALPFALQQPRKGNNWRMTIFAVLTGFGFYLFTHFVYTLGVTGVLPLFLAGFMPALVVLLLGVSYLFHIENG